MNANPFAVTLDLDTIRRIAASWSKLTPSTNPLSLSFEEVGVAGQWTFAAWSGLPMDEARYTNGRQRPHFTAPNGRTVNVVTSAKATMHQFLRRVDSGVPWADVYVAVVIDLERGLGIVRAWVDGATFRQRGRVIEPLVPNGPRNYALPFSAGSTPSTLRAALGLEAARAEPVEAAQLGLWG